MPSLAAIDLGDLDVEALGLAVEALRPKTGLVELRADGDLAGLATSFSIVVPAAKVGLSAGAVVLVVSLPPQAASVMAPAMSAAATVRWRSVRMR